MMFTRTALFAMLASLGCTDLPSHDDPREATEFIDEASTSGECTGLSVSCDQRAAAQCHAGCMVVARICHSRAVEVCSPITNPDACDVYSACSWDSGVCELRSGLSCDSFQSKTACDDSGLECSWGSACAGQATPCFKMKTASECTANLGCAWDADP
jgi:hypothetical protein